MFISALLLSGFPFPSRLRHVPELSCQDVSVIRKHCNMSEGFRRD